MDKKIKFIYILFISFISFCLFLNHPKATVTCERTKREDYSVSFHVYDTSDTEHEGELITMKLDSDTNKLESLNICGKKITDFSKKTYTCDVPGAQTYIISFGSLDLSQKIYKFTDNVTCGMAAGSTVNISGITNMSEGTTKNAVICNGANYNFVFRKGQDNQSTCQVVIMQADTGADVIMKHGKTTINPLHGKYICKNFEGDEAEFYLEKDLTKGSLNSTSDCPTLTIVSGSDGTQSEIENPIVGPTEEPEIPVKEDDGPKIISGDTANLTIQNLINIYSGAITCDGLRTMTILIDVFRYIRIAGVVLFIVLTSADYVKCIVSSDSSMFKKANSRVVKRVIILIVILMLPAIITLITNIINLTSGTCGVK